ncbi:hypothetical protein ACG98G_01280 [Megasphaera hexanoica]|uniref:Uncharacterized protein n=1 Tax=Megasphaera hexanoica TaxID=1675036 RepID=A0ABW7DPR4_9FIRM|nr:hypothetical protein [Megasphaera hexanoica]
MKKENAKREMVSISKTDKKQNHMRRSSLDYAKKLVNFLRFREYDKDVCVLLGVIAKTSMKKHSYLDDEIRVAITSLTLNEPYAAVLIAEADGFINEF